MTEYRDPEPKPYAGIIFEGVNTVASKFLYSPAATVVLLLGIALTLNNGSFGVATTFVVILALQAVMTFTDREPLVWFLKRVLPDNIDEDADLELTQSDYVAGMGLWFLPLIIAEFFGSYGHLIGFVFIFVEVAIFAQLLARRMPAKEEGSK